MGEVRGPAGVLGDLSLLYELSLSVGSSLDSRACCESFLKTIMARKNLDHASVWVCRSHLTGDEDQTTYQLLYSSPEFRTRETSLPADHPLPTALLGRDAISLSVRDDGFQALVTEAGIGSGRFAVFRLGDLGFLKIHSTVSDAPFDEVELNQLRNVLAKLAITLEGCFAHERLVREAAERERAEAALQESEERYRHLFDDNPSMYFTLDRDGTVISVNRFGASQLGYSVDELIGQPVLAVFHEEDKAAVREQFEKALSNPGRVFRWSFRKIRKDGSVIWVEEFARAIKQRVLIVCQDITEQKAAEDEHRRLQLQIQHAQKMESLGILAGGVAHDFNNLLTGVLGNAELALLDVPPSSPTRGFLENIEKAALRAADLCKQLLAYSGRGKFVIQPVCLNTVISEMADLLRASVTRRVDLRFELADDLPWIEGDPTQMAQIVMNLVSNASEAIGDSHGDIAVSTGAIDCDGDFLRDSFLGKELRPGPYVYVRIADTGCGMDTETLDRIFDPFFTTKFTGRGLGLAAVLGIVRGHHGTLTIDSEAGRGTTFTVLFPRTASGCTSPPDETDSPANWRGSGTILIIDDEESARDVGRTVLERIGFDVITARDGAEGVETFRIHADAISLVLLDLTMPVMDGASAIEAIRAIRSDVPVILCSGYDEREAAGRFVGKGLAGFLQKPYQMRDITDRIRSVLEERGLA